ncbi:2OG-Fe(II) oxygenase [Oscillatoria sp. FACHB-1407]|uniref:2OG-Fe(II) oxygenase n=1 Tax=Oscillatoria sp. FACHB-1407 TaxID=2692847 RepID=UPI001683F877|nr:2OG-Fe(II) oxygenase [Oscillatoria sp. FACHB-1407]MBD2461154.1 2OG-Fe(II) oxygenase [Oscillatoria sp. FACHB-1407]
MLLPHDPTTHTSSIAQRVNTIDWLTILQTLDRQGFATLNSLLTVTECQQLAYSYSDDTLFRSRIVMERYRFGHGEYQYFAYPLPSQVQSLRESVYPQLVPLANQWHSILGIETRFPDQLGRFLETCHQAGQIRPTPLLLKYEVGDYNCLHQDLYGELTFPFQVAIALSEPGRDFLGSEFVLTEQKPRSQSRVHVVNLHQGDAVIFAVNHRPVQGTKGFYRATLKHGVSALHSGRRFCLGIIFHDAA